MLDSQLNGAQLQQLAGQRPDLWPQILAHPNCYPELAQWIQASMSGPAQSSNPAQPVQPEGQAQPAQPQPTQPVHPQVSIENKNASKKKTGKGGKITVISLLVAVVVAALALAGIWLYPIIFAPEASAAVFAKGALVRSTDMPEYTKVKAFYSYGDHVVFGGEKNFYSWDDKVAKFGSTIHKQAPLGVVETNGKAAPQDAIPALSKGDSVPWLPNPKEPEKPRKVALDSVTGKNPVTGGNDTKVCQSSGQAVDCKGFDGKGSQQVKPADKLQALGGFPLDDGMVAVFKNPDTGQLQIVVKPDKGAEKKFDLGPDVFQNVWEFLGYESDGKTRRVPTPSTGLSSAELIQALDAKANFIALIDGKVCVRAKAFEAKWVCEGVTYEGLVGPLLADDEYLVGTAGGMLDANGQATGATMIVVFDKSGKLVRSYPLEGPSEVWTSAGKIYTVLTGKDSKSAKLFEFGGDKGQKAKSETKVKLPAPLDPNGIKKFDFGNFTASEGDDQLNWIWKMKDNKGQIDFKYDSRVLPLEVTLYPDKTLYADLDGDGILDAAAKVVFCGNAIDGGERGCYSSLALFLWDLGKQKPIFVGFPQLVGGSYMANYVFGTTEQDALRENKYNVIKVVDNKLETSVPWLRITADQPAVSVMRVWRPTRTIYFENPKEAYPPRMWHFQGLSTPLIDLSGKTMRVAPDDNAPQIGAGLLKFANKDISPGAHKNGYTLYYGAAEDKCFPNGIDDEYNVIADCMYAAWVKDQ